MNDQEKDRVTRLFMVMLAVIIAQWILIFVLACSQAPAVGAIGNGQVTGEVIFLQPGETKLLEIRCEIPTPTFTISPLPPPPPPPSLMHSWGQ